MKCEISRRSFLRGLSASSLFASGGCASILSSRSPNSLLCHACVGTANMANYDLKAFLANPGVQITALCDVDAEFLAAAKKLVPDARVYTDWREMLAAEGDRLDSVNVSTPDHTHTPIVASALRAGKNVYSQKPLCKFLDEAQLLKRIAAESGKVTQLGTQLAAGPTDRLCIRILEDGVIGPVRRVMMFSTRNGSMRIPRFVPKTGPVPSTLDWDKWLGPAPWRAYSETYHPTKWRIFTDFGTGWVGDLCIHIINSPWMGLGCGNAAPLSVRAEVDAAALSDPVCRGTWPLYSHIVWDMPGVRGSGMKPFALEWFSGLSEQPGTPENFLPPGICREIAAKSLLGKLPLEGRVIEGELGYMLVPHGFGDAKDPVGLPTVVMKDGGTPPPLPALDPAPSHYDEYVLRCREGGKARSDFSKVISLMEAVIMGGVAERIPNVVHRWDAAARTFDSAAANAVVKSSYRKGWALEGLGGNEHQHDEFPRGF